MADVELSTLGSVIKTAYEGQSNTNAFTDTEQTKLAGIETGAEVNIVDSVNSQTGVVVLDADDIDDTSTTHKFTTAGDISKLAGIETGAEVNTINSDPTTDGVTGSDQVTNIVSCTQAEYDAGTPDSATFYLITDAT